MHCRSWWTVISVALLLRIGVLAYLGPVIHGDTPGYKHVAHYLAEHHRFVVPSPIDQSLEPFTFRVPLFIVTWALVDGIGLTQPVQDWVEALLQVGYSTLTVVFVGLAAGVAFGTQATFPAAWLAAF